MNTSNSRLFSIKKAGLYLPLLALAFIVMILHFHSQKSQYTGQSSESCVCSSLSQQYPLETDKIIISSSNNGNAPQSFSHPHLEYQRNGTWYYAKRNRNENMTAELPGVSPGITSSYTLYLEEYAPYLTVGHYRAVFPFFGSFGYFSFEFDIVK